jgi:hypothetical protein
VPVVFASKVSSASRRTGCSAAAVGGGQQIAGAVVDFEYASDEGNAVGDPDRGILPDLIGLAGGQVTWK